MKIRYFLATLLSMGLLAYGAIRLVVLAKERSSVQVQLLFTPLDKITADPVVTPPAGTDIPTVPIDAPVTATAAGTPSPTPVTSDTTRLHWGERTPGVIRKVKVDDNNGIRTLFLTVNVYHSTHAALIESLIAHNVKATIFSSGYFARRNAGILRQWARNSLFDIQNLGDRFRSLSSQGQSVYNIEGTKNVQDALNEVNNGARDISAVVGKQPIYYRSATGYTDNVAVAAVNTAGTKVIGYEKVTDGGGLISSEQVKNNILQAASGSILVISVNPEYPNILSGLQAALDEIKTKQLPIKFEKLADYETAFESF